MGARVRIEFESDGFRQVLSGDAVGSLVSSVAAGVARAAPGAESRVFAGAYGGGRPIGVAVVRRRRFADGGAFQAAVRVLEGAVHG